MYWLTFNLFQSKRADSSCWKNAAEIAPALLAVTAAEKEEDERHDVSYDVRTEESNIKQLLLTSLHVPVLLSTFMHQHGS
jgi:hypothetical protein